MGSQTGVTTTDVQKYTNVLLRQDQTHDICILSVLFLIRAVEQREGATLETFKQAWKDLKFSYIFTVRYIHVRIFINNFRHMWPKSDASSTL